MVRLNGSELARLQARTAAFSSASHLRYIAEALQTTSISQDPVEALELLYAMWGTAYAKTPHEKKALNDVGAWFERRLLDDPAVDAARIALELAWAARLTRIAEARASFERDSSTNLANRNRSSHTNRSADGPTFGKHIGTIERRRAETLSARQKHLEAQQPGIAKPSLSAERERLEVPLPTTLPSVFEAEFIKFSDARDAFHDAKNREKKNKPPKERFLPIRPVDVRLRPLAEKLTCSTKLEGFKKLFEAISAAGGSERTFFVQGITEAQERCVVVNMLLVPPVIDVERS